VLLLEVYYLRYTLERYAMFNSAFLFAPVFRLLNFPNPLQSHLVSRKLLALLALLEPPDYGTDEVDHSHLGRHIELSG